MKTASNPNDKRANLVSITPLGQEFLNEHIKISNRVFNDIISKMNKEEKKEFLDAMETIYVLLNKIN